MEKFKLWKCDNCDVELDEADGYLPNKMGNVDFCDTCYGWYQEMRYKMQVVDKSFKI